MRAQADGVADGRDGLRLLECTGLRVKGINFDRGELTIRDGKDGKDRVTMLGWARGRLPRATPIIAGCACDSLRNRRQRRHT